MGQRPHLGVYWLGIFVAVVAAAVPSAPYAGQRQNQHSIMRGMPRTREVSEQRAGGGELLSAWYC